MRITGGEKRGLKLLSPKGVNIRPTSEKIRLAVFNILFQRISDARFFDLCCGTGIMAMEALSRGAEQAVLVDTSDESGRTVHRNLERSDFASRAVFHRSDVVRFCRSMLLPVDQLSILYLDPPYRDVRLYRNVIRTVDQRAAGKQVILIVEHPTSLEVEGGPELAIRSTHHYGEKQITLFTSQTVVW